MGREETVGGLGLSVTDILQVFGEFAHFHYVLLLTDSITRAVSGLLWRVKLHREE